MLACLSQVCGLCTFTIGNHVQIERPAISPLLLPALDFGTVYLLTSGLPRHWQHFIKSWKLIYFGNLSHCFITASP